MKFGISVATVGAFAEPRFHQEFSRHAEAHGWDGYFLWDGVAHAYRPVLEPWVGLAAIAASTERIALGPLVSAVVFHRPRQLAATIASLARLSGGRLIVGAGAGDAPEDELARMNEAPLAQRTLRLDEMLTTVSDMLGSEGLAVPFWLAASDPLRHRAALRRAARYGGVCPMGLDRPPSEIREIHDYIARRRAEPFDLAVFASFASVGRAEAMDRVRAYTAVGVTWMIETLAPWTHSLDAARILVEAGRPRE